MRAISLALLSGASLPHGAVVDLGCGGGAMLADLQNRFPGRSVFGIDLHPLAVEQTSMVSPGRVIQSNIEKLPLPNDSVALLTALDSFDQRGVDPAHSLYESRRVLCHGGLLLLRVSAFAGLASPHDRAFNTACRYEREQMVRTVTDSGLRVIRSTYANMLLSPPVAVIRLLQKHGLLALSESLYANLADNLLMTTALSVESVALRRCDLPFGLSLYILACKE